ncbi:MAG: hypothetical protein RBT41_12505 [Clostridia bacterium]|jgi:hypothetical protein|nr:hypothetical protein [Clostridia bacterium]
MPKNKIKNPPAKQPEGWRPDGTASSGREASGSDAGGPGKASISVAGLQGTQFQKSGHSHPEYKKE